MVDEIIKHKLELGGELEGEVTNFEPAECEMHHNAHLGLNHGQRKL